MEVASGIYSRIIFQDANTKIETQLTDLQKKMLDATPDCIKVLSKDGKLLMMNRAGCQALGVREDCDFGMAWLTLLPEDVQETGQHALAEAVAGRPARFLGKSLSLEGVRYWDNLLTPLTDSSGHVLSILCVSRDVTTKALLEIQLEEAVARERLVSREMQHRIKNLFSVVSGLISIAEKEASLEQSTGTTTAILRDKLAALSRASDAVFFAQDGRDNDVASRVDLATIVHSVLQPYGDRCFIAGSPISIRYRFVSTFALFLHELATNSVKYGSLSSDIGVITVRWMEKDGKLLLTWIETDGPTISSSPRRRGFGSEMVDRIVRSAGGSIDRSWQSGGLIVELCFDALEVGLNEA